MIGAVMAKKEARSIFNALSRRDLAKVTAVLAEDATWTFPGNVPISGETKGKKAFEAALTNWMAHFPKITFTIKEIYVSNIFAIGATNNIAIEWEIAMTNLKGKEFHNSGVSIMRVKGGKAVAEKEYLFSTDVLNEGWVEA
jgi:ketosteroid isomerase-like protein